jgi:hypothetical protein
LETKPNDNNNVRQTQYLRKMRLGIKKKIANLFT